MELIYGEESEGDAALHLLTVATVEEGKDRSLLGLLCLVDPRINFAFSSFLVA